MNLYSALVWIASGVVVFISFLMAVTRKPMWLNDKKYTYVSLVEFSRLAGILGMIIGITGGYVLYCLSKGQTSILFLIALVVLCASYGSFHYFKKKLLVAKGTKTKNIKK